ncbi:MAG: twin-arginine translocase TatA/TatE family subunit [Bacteroidetes bacterium]|nr:twin-arginine translocase TatA/TatE family subunit [Bacteroidota bacterium]MBL0098085.1 twin-arginine translocase TatA/TatE family subunit [Bacteroidota bacterium]
MMTAIILFLESLGGGELVVILLFVLLFFGSKNIPSLARGLGSGIRQFKDAMNGVQSEIKQGMHEVEKQANILAVEEKAKQEAKVSSNPITAEPTAETPQQEAPIISPEERSAAR